MNNIENHMVLPDFEERPMRQDEDGSLHFDYERTCEPAELAQFRKLYPSAYKLLWEWHELGKNDFTDLDRDSQFEIVQAIFNDDDDVYVDCMIDIKEDLLKMSTGILVIPSLVDIKVLFRKLIQYCCYYTHVDEFFDWVMEWKHPDNGAGADPMIAMRTGVKVDLLSTYTAEEVASCVKEALNGNQTNFINNAGRYFDE